MNDEIYNAALKKLLKEMTPEEAKAFQAKVKTLNDPEMDELVKQFVDAVTAQSN